MLFILASFVSSSFYYPHDEKSFLLWMRSTNQIYTGEDYHIRFGIFLTNSRYVKDHNKKNKKFTLTLNQFAAYTPSEYKAILKLKPFRPKRNIKQPETTHVASTQFDWREKGYVNPVESMLQCVADWAFAAIQSLETVYAISTGSLKKFSEQHLIDCITSCSGCKGGDTNAAYDAIIENGGFVCYQTDYPFTGAQGDCQYGSKQHVGPVITSYTEVPEGNEEDMAIKIELYGPASAIIDASHSSFQLYHSGVYNEPSCDPYILSLSVGVVGYGVDGDDQYWIVRNAWGPSWGEEGYIRMLRGNNQCGIASWASVLKID